MMYLTVNNIGDSTGLFGDYDTHDVELFGDADGTAMAQSEVGVDVHAGSDGQDAAGGQDAVALDYDGTIVQGRVLEEEVFEEGSGGVGIDTLACVDYLLQVVGAFEDDECAGLALGHVHTGLHVGVEIEACLFIGIVAPEAKTLDERVARQAGLGAYEEEEFAYLGLEDDDKGYETDAHDAPEDLAAKAHVEEVEDAPGQIDDYDGPEDAHDVGATDQPIKPVDEDGDHEDVEDVDKTDLGKGDRCKWHDCVCCLLFIKRIKEV